LCLSNGSCDASASSGVCAVKPIPFILNPDDTSVIVAGSSWVVDIGMGKKLKLKAVKFPYRSRVDGLKYTTKIESLTC
jgi:hypothetical protein